ncbi:hypothetical protein ACP70R_049509 [Stipagrostis hirtigluma subsp. patula]
MEGSKTMESPICSLGSTMLNLPGRLHGLLQRHGQMLPRGAAAEIPLVQRDLEEIIGMLTEHKGESAMVVKCWTKEVRELMYDIEDFVDQYDHAARGLRIRSMPHRRKIVRFKRSKPSLAWHNEKLRQRLWMANKIREFSLRVQEALRRHSMYNLSGIAGSCATTPCNDASSFASWQPGTFPDDDVHVRNGDAMNTLEEWLMSTHDGAEKLKVVSIFGFGGIGKTTLANELYHKLGWQFECQAFVRMSQKPDMRRLFISMLSQINPRQSPDNWMVHSLISSIRTHLQDKRYLIIVDHLWDLSTWDVIKCALPDGNSHSRIVITTEIEDLALQSCAYDSNYVLKMKPLGEVDSRKLFFSSVFGSNNGCPTELWEVSNAIIRKCGGLPLAIVIIASILASRPGIQEQWDYVNQSLGYSLVTNPTLEGMKQVLDLCYNNFPQNLKECMLYISIYEENNIIWKRDLVSQWIAEGFISAADGEEKEEISKAYFDELISRKVIQPVEVNDSGEVVSFVVHHMVHNLIMEKKSIEENFVTAIHHSQATTTLADKVRRLSLHFGNAEDAMPPTNMRLSQVRTLAYSGVFKCMPSFMEFRLLQVLILQFLGDKDIITLDLTRISELFRLKYLKLASNVTLELQTEMRGLQYLETLCIDARVTEVPSDITHLPGLRHLSLPAEVNLPLGIGHMTSLRTLRYFDLSCNARENELSLSKLTNLRDLQLTCCYTAQEHENLKNKMQFQLGLILGELINLKSLTLVPTSSNYDNSVDYFGCISMSISGDSFSSAPSALTLLQLSPRICIFSGLPKCIGQLSKLCVLKIGVRKLQRSDVDILSGMHALAVLSLSVQTKPTEMIVIGNAGFFGLKYLKFICCDFRFKFEANAMPNLRKLKIGFNAHNACQRTTIPVGIEHLSGLKEVIAKIGVAGLMESSRKVAELGFGETIRDRVHASCCRIIVQCVNKIFGCQEDQSSVTRKEEKNYVRQIQHCASTLSSPFLSPAQGCLPALRHQGKGMMMRQVGVASTPVPEWLETLLSTRFFLPCAAHPTSPRNECNMFCLDCRGAPPPAFCYHCHVDRHGGHRVIQIRRSSYHDVVRVSDVQDVLDIAGVQTYVINSARVLFLNERPQPRSAGKATASPNNCEICGRALLDQFRFCSLRCKLVYTKRSNGHAAAAGAGAADTGAGVADTEAGVA